MANKPRAGAVRKKGKKVAAGGTGGHGRKALEGRGPTPKAEDRPYHPAAKAKARAERDAAKTPQRQSSPARRSAPTPRRSKDGTEVVAGRNSVVEALMAKIPANALYLTARMDVDERVREAIAVANHRGIPILEVTKVDLDRMTGPDAVHQGIALKVPEYEYAPPMDVLDAIEARGAVPLIVALDGVTDPRNLGAILRSAAAFGGQAVVVPQRRSVGVTAAVWKTSAGAAARIPVAMAGNLVSTLKEFKRRGVFVVGLDGAGEVSLPDLTLGADPLVIVVGSEGKGLSRLVTETCDEVVSIPIDAATESLNAGIAASVTLYEVSRARAQALA